MLTRDCLTTESEKWGSDRFGEKGLPNSTTPEISSGKHQLRPIVKIGDWSAIWGPPEGKRTLPQKEGEVTPSILKANVLKHVPSLAETKRDRMREGGGLACGRRNTGLGPGEKKTRL